MGTAINRLSPTRIDSLIRRAQKDCENLKGRRQVIADGGGLYLQISPTATPSWIFRYSRQKIARCLGLGPYPEIGLGQARERAEKCRKMLANGDLPRLQAVLQVQDVKPDAEKENFSSCAMLYIQEHQSGWRNSKHTQQWVNTLRTYAFPVIGEKPVAEISAQDVQSVLMPIWLQKHETACRLRGRIESVLDWARVRGYRENDNPARLRGNLEYLLPRVPRITLIRRHHPSLPHNEISGLCGYIQANAGSAARALEFLILSAGRTSEVTLAEWPEIDLSAGIWTVPAERMKSGRTHRVPLTVRMTEILEEQRTSSVSRYIFPGRADGRPLSNMAMKALLRRIGHGSITVHGFRSTFRDWAAECTHYDSRVAELALAHTDQNKVRKAYQRSDLLEQRREMMIQWEKRCYPSPTGPLMVEQREGKAIHSPGICFEGNPGG